MAKDTAAETRKLVNALLEDRAASTSDPGRVAAIDKQLATYGITPERQSAPKVTTADSRPKRKA